MKKAVLIANRCNNIPIIENSDYIGIDKGAFLCLQKNIPMKFALGDFDSIQENQLEELKRSTKIISLPCRKNETDGEYAIRYVHNLGYQDIEVYGVIGGRQDHFMTIFNLLKYYNINFKIIDEYNCIYRLDKGIHTIKKNSKYLSIFACEDIMISLNGVEYPLDNVHISEKDLYLISNEIIDIATLTTSGKVIIFETND